VNVAWNVYIGWTSELAWNQAFFSFASFQLFVHQGACWADLNAGKAKLAARFFVITINMRAGNLVAVHLQKIQCLYASEVTTSPDTLTAGNAQIIIKLEIRIIPVDWQIPIFRNYGFAFKIKKINYFR
jgi:hypothetical protein